MTRYAPGSTVTAPSGRVTIAQAAEISGLSYAEVHRRCREKLIPSARQAENDTWSMLRADARKLGRRTPSDDNRVALSQIRVPRARHEAWEREARRRGCTVRELAVALLDAASGWNQER